MKRVVSQRQVQAGLMHDETDSASEPQDRITFDIVGGTLCVVVPPELADDQVLQDDWISRDAYCVFKLENGAEVEFWISDGPCTAHVRKFS